MSAPTIHLEVEGRFHDYTTYGLVQAAIEVLRDGDVILGVGDLDYAAADMLEVLGVMHEQTGIDLELLPQVRAFCVTMLDQAGWSE